MFTTLVVPTAWTKVEANGLSNAYAWKHENEVKFAMAVHTALV